MKRTKQKERIVVKIGPDSCISIMTSQWAISPQIKLLCQSVPASLQLQSQSNNSKSTLAKVWQSQKAAGTSEDLDLDRKVPKMSLQKMFIWRIWGRPLTCRSSKEAGVGSCQWISPAIKWPRSPRGTNKSLVSEVLLEGKGPRGNKKSLTSRGSQVLLKAEVLETYSSAGEWRQQKSSASIVEARRPSKIKKARTW